VEGNRRELLDTPSPPATTGSSDTPLSALGDRVEDLLGRRRKETARFNTRQRVRARDAGRCTIRDQTPSKRRLYNMGAAERPPRPGLYDYDISYSP
jgi:hypothetical protein